MWLGARPGANAIRLRHVKIARRADTHELHQPQAILRLWIAIARGLPAPCARCRGVERGRSESAITVLLRRRIRVDGARGGGRSRPWEPQLLLRRLFLLCAGYSQAKPGRYPRFAKSCRSAQRLRLIGILINAKTDQIKHAHSVQAPRVVLAGRTAAPIRDAGDLKLALRGIEIERAKLGGRFRIAFSIKLLPVCNRSRPIPLLHRLPRARRIVVGRYGKCVRDRQ